MKKHQLLKGRHLLIDVFGCDIREMNDKDKIREFLKNLVKKIDMKQLSYVYVYDAVDEELDGITGFVVITTSHISIHTFIDTKHFWLDVFSCKKYDKKRVIEFIMKEFNVERKNIKTKTVIRGYKNE